MSKPMVTRRGLAIDSDGVRLSADVFVPEVSKGSVVLLHGIPTVAPPDPDDEGYPGWARRFAERGWAAAWADMRAAHGAPGFFSIEGWVTDGTAMVDAIRDLDGVMRRPVVLVGSSAGGAVALEAVARGAPADAVATLGTPAAWGSFAADPAAGVRRIIEEAGMPLSKNTLADPVSWASEFGRVTPETSIGRLHVPLLIVHGTADDVVPVGHAYRLSHAAPDAELVVLSGAPHHLRRHPGVFEVVLGWIERSFR
jgi:fermentation-respiration switch protein FrsA (DUF1100 family)